MVEKEQWQQEAKTEAYNEMTNQRHLKQETEKKHIEEEKKWQWKKVVEETGNQTQQKEKYANLCSMLWGEEL